MDTDVDMRDDSEEEFEFINEQSVPITNSRRFFSSNDFDEFDDELIQQELNSLEEYISRFGIDQDNDDHAVLFIEFNNDLFHVCREILAGGISEQTRDSEVWSQFEDCCHSLDQKHLFFALGHLPFTYDPENLHEILDEQEIENQCICETSLITLLQKIHKICTVEQQDAVAAGVSETLNVVQESILFGSSLNSLV
jgi:hypothetical protein